MDYRPARRQHQLRAWLSAVLRVDRLRASRTARTSRWCYDALKRELFAAARGRGAQLNGRPIHVSATPSLDRALLATAFPYDQRERRNFYLTFWEVFMMRTPGVRYTGSAVLDLCYVAWGRVDALCEFGLRPWDSAAGALIVTEAGGRMTNLDGSALDLDVRFSSPTRWAWSFNGDGELFNIIPGRRSRSPRSGAHRLGAPALHRRPGHRSSGAIPRRWSLPHLVRLPAWPQQRGWACLPRFFSWLSAGRLFAREHVRQVHSDQL